MSHMNEPRQGASSSRVMNHREQIVVLETACQWLGIPSGRAHDYQRLIKEYWEGRSRTDEHILVHNESYEIIDLYELWNDRTDEFPGIKAKVASAVGGGPILTENELVSTSSNRPRNDAFVYLLAGELIQAGINVLAVDGVLRRGATCHSAGDITFDWGSRMVDFQCKRPQSENALLPRISEARRQIEIVGEQIMGGIIAVDFSAFIRPKGQLIEKASSAEAAEACRILIEKWVPIAARELRPSILGFYFYARVPAMIVIKESQVLTTSGRPYKEYRPVSVTGEGLIPNADCRAPDILPAVYDRLRVALSDSAQ